ncbi:MAG: hypothetical protein Q9202_001345 [Teloschistes flavicans]
MSSTQPVQEDFFNDLARQPSLPTPGTQTVTMDNSQPSNNERSELPKPKRVACAICRKRKLKCDGGRPKCGTCARLGHNCAYDEVRRKSGPKRGYVKELEARLAQVETQLQTKTKEKEKIPPISRESSQSQDPPAHTPPSDHALPTVSSNGASMPMPGPDMDYFDPLLVQNISVPDAGPDIQDMLPDLDLGAFDEPMTWEMVGLGLEEPLPTQEAIDELHDIYFQYVHPSMPIIHPYRYRAAMALSPHMRPPVALRYSIWALAANMSLKYQAHKDIFYRRARKYAEIDEMRGLGEAYVTVAHCQCWILNATHEFQHMYFPRAWSSVGRSVRLAMMMGFNRIDGAGMDVKQVLPPPRDWTEREERRRTFWMAYCIDRYASMGTGWPLAIDENDIMTNLPSHEENYEKSIPQDTVSLSKCMTPEGAANLSPFSGVIFMAHIFGRNLNHLHRPGPDDADEDLQGGFWKRHRHLDNTLLKTSLMLPAHLRLPTGIRDPNIIFINMSIHTSTICLHQAAIHKVETKKLPPNMIEQSSTRCLLAATEIANIMRMISHMDCLGMNPFLAFCLYVAARVFIHVLKKSPNESQIRSSLEFIVVAMQHFKKINPLSDSFLIQLSLDLEGTELDFTLQNPSHSAAALHTLKQARKFETSIGCGPPKADIKDGNKHMHPLHPAVLRPSQYSMQSFDLPTRDSPRTVPGFPNANGPLAGSMISVVEGNGWGQDFDGGPTGVADWVNKSNETDASSRQNSSDHGSSSNTSYSPRSPEEDPSSTASLAAGHPPQHLFEFTNLAANLVSVAPSPPQPMQDSFKTSSPWEFGPGAAMNTPNNVATGMTPASDNDWSHLLDNADNMNWASTMSDATETLWPPNSGPPT